MIRRTFLAFLLALTLLTGFGIPTAYAAGVGSDRLPIEAGEKTSINGAYPDYLRGYMYCQLLYSPGSKDAYVTVGLNLASTWAASVIKRLVLPYSFTGTIIESGQTRTLVVTRTLAFTNAYAIPPFKAKTMAINSGSQSLGGHLTIPVTLMNTELPTVSVRLFNVGKLRAGSTAQNVTWFPATTRDKVEATIRKVTGVGQPSVTCMLLKRDRRKTVLEQIRDSITGALKYLVENPPDLSLPPLPIPIPIPGRDMI